MPSLLSTTTVALAAAAAAAASGAAGSPAPTLLPAPVIAARAAAMVGGAFLTDAAVMPLHWIYDTAEIRRLVGQGDPAFFPTPSCPFYQYALGESTPYGQQTMAHLSVGAATGAVAPEDLQTAYYDIYKAGGPAAAGGWYRDASTKAFVANVAAGRVWPSSGAQDSQADALAHVIPVVALLAGDTAAMLAAAETAIRVTQDTDEAAAFGLAAARVLEQVVAYNASGYAAVAAAAAALTDPARASPHAQDADLAQGMLAALAAVGESNLAYTLATGQACEYHYNLLTGSQLLGQVTRFGSVDAYTNVTRQVILAGGDSASRGMFVGAATAAALGDVALLPAAWTAQALGWPCVAPLVAQVVARRKA
jgi:hypothetical protein